VDPRHGRSPTRTGGDDRPRERHTRRASCDATSARSARERTYDDLQLAVGERVICRRNDRELDIDSGMRGTVRHLGADHVVIDTDSGLARELSGDYAAEHLEHAYALTGHGMQGGTVEAATVVASPTT
jgi:ATP-dependent exoDNAse (exonuclease V) alpha subunit